MINAAGSVEGVLEQLGIQIASTGKEIACHCPFHKDNHPSFSINAQTGLWICLAGETNVWTWDGLVPIKDLAGKTSRLLTSAGWVDAPVREFGNQQLWKIELSRTGRKKTIYATAEHRWFIDNHGKKRERVTSDLRPKDRLWHRAFPTKHAGVLSPWGIAHGITFGDGWLQSGHRAASVTLWGDKDRELLKFFPLSPTCHDSNPGDGVTGIRVMNLPRAWKGYPDLRESNSYLLGWLAGYFAADGSVSELGHVRLNSAREEDLKFVQLICARIGITTFEIGCQVRRGKGVEDSKIYFLDFVRSSLPKDFYLLSAHALRSKRKFKYERLRWQVVSVEPTDRVEPVYCAVIEGTQDFVLEGNILTGNCYQCTQSGTLSMLVSLVGNGANPVEVLRKLRHDRTRRPRANEPEPIPEINIDPFILFAKYESFKNVPQWALDEKKFDAQTAKRFGIKWDRGFVIPVWSAERLPDLLGWQFKRLDFVSNYPKTIKKSTTLFGLRELESTTAVIVESPLDVARLAVVGIPALAPYGAYVSNAQLRLMIDNLERVVLAFDNDTAGQENQAKVYPKLSRKMPTIRAVYPDGLKDPGDASDEEVRQIFSDISWFTSSIPKRSGRHDARSPAFITRP